MLKEGTKQVYVFCNICQENIPIGIDEIEVGKMKSGIISVLPVHGDPYHAVLVYLDATFKIRDTEYPSYLQIAENDGLDVKSRILTR